MATWRIMVVEDEAVVAMEIEKRLTDLGYGIAGTFARGEQALEKVGELNPDLILMDIKLSGTMDGIQTATRIRMQHDIPVVYLTAHSDDGTLQRALGAGPLGYIVKPFSEAELHATIEVCLKKHMSDKTAQETTRWFSRAIETIGGAIILTDEDGIVKQINSLATGLTGWKREDALGRNVTDVFKIADSRSGNFIEHFQLLRSREGFASSTFTCALIGDDQADTPIEVIILPVGDSHGKLRNVIFAFGEKIGNEQTDQDWLSISANLLMEAALCRCDREYAKALTFYERALAILEANEGRASRRICGVLEDVADMYRSTGQNEDALISAVRAQRVHSSTSGVHRSSKYGTTSGARGYA